MEHYAGIDVSLEASSVCVLDASGKVVREAKVASEPEALTAWFARLGLEVARIGLEAGPLSQWLHGAMTGAGLRVELLETRHVRTAIKTMPVKTDRSDARGIAQLMRLGWKVFLPTSLAAVAAVGAFPAGTCCPQGQCEFASGAVGNIDNDVTYDEWFITSQNGIASA